MIMDLPKKFKISFAEVKNGQLYIHSLMRYEDLMYELTYASKKRQCIYCDRKLNRKNSTLDHAYPRDTGGVSITNNLFPACHNCNSSKSNLTYDEFMRMRKLPKNHQNDYMEFLQEERERILKTKGFKLPNKWIIYMNTKNIKYRKISEDLRGKKYYRIVEFYEKYHRLPRPAIVDKNNRLLDGYNVILVAKDFHIRQIPVIKLDNVELLNN